jgi:hypothetical protein
MINLTLKSEALQMKPEKYSTNNGIGKLNSANAT